MKRSFKNRVLASAMTFTMCLVQVTLLQSISATGSDDAFVPDSTYFDKNFYSYSHDKSGSCTTPSDGDVCASDLAVSISPSLISREESRYGDMDYEFTVSLNKSPQECDVKIDYSTVDGATGYQSAIAGTDYLPVSGSLYFNNSTQETISISIIPDDDGLSEAEAFSVVLSNPVNVIVSDTVGVGVITEQEL